MLSFLKNHPFAVEAYFDKSIVLTYAVPKEQLQLLIPACVTLDTFQDKWAFIAIAMVQTKHLRPKGFPKFMGSDFFLIGYRIFVRYTNEQGKSLRGLYILKSETDSKKMEQRGNLFTHYKYTKEDIVINEIQNRVKVNALNSEFNVEVEIPQVGQEVELPIDSPFSNWKEARRFAGPLPFTFTYKPATNQVLIVEGVRQNWIPSPIEVKCAEIPFIKILAIEGVVLANAFIIKEVPYYWKKGRVESWKN